MPTQRDLAWAATMLLLEQDGQTSIADVRDHAEQLTDSPPSRKVLYDCFRAMEDLGLVETVDTDEHDPKQISLVADSEDSKRPNAA